jgi:hypothetical protein
LEALPVARKQKDLVTPLLWVVIGVGVGAAVYYSIKLTQKPATLPPGTPGGPSLPPATGTPPSPGPRAPTPPAPSALVSRLTGSAEARKIFLFQAGMFSYAQIQDLPDGEFGPKTRQMVRVINNAAASANASSDWSDAVLRRLASGLKTLNSTSDLSRVQARVVPSLLPLALIQQVNADGVAVAADVPLLQMLPAS